MSAEPHKKDAFPVGKKIYHMAGIVPLATAPLDFNMPWHDSLILLAPNFTAVERAVLECSVMGCNTIWIVCHEHMTPLLKHRLGEWVIEGTEKVIQQAEHFGDDYAICRRARRIPIYYVPIYPGDLNHLDGEVWSILHGALVSYRVARTLSKYVVPYSYYVAPPYGVYDIHEVRRKYIREVRKSRRNFFLAHNGKTALDGERLAFTFLGSQLVGIKELFREMGQGMYKCAEIVLSSDNSKSTLKEIKNSMERLPPEGRYTYRYLTIPEVFGKYNYKDKYFAEVDWCHRIDSWEEYRKFLSCEDYSRLKTRYKEIFYDPKEAKKRRWQGMRCEDGND